MVEQPRIIPEYNLIYEQWGFRLLYDYSYKTVDGISGVIPADYWWNGANIPAAFWQLILAPNDQRILAPSLVHDWLYTIRRFSKDVADKTLCKYLENVGLPSYKIMLIGKAVRSFGRSAWSDSYKDRAYLLTLRKQLLNSGKNLGDYFIA